jgi:hypothetical protein
MERRGNMFGHKTKGPSKPFQHADDCKILKADPDVEIPWNETRPGHFEATCQCGREFYDEPAADLRTRLDPLDPSTSLHAGECEFVSETDPTILRALLKVQDKETYAWVECGGCNSGWQVPYYAAERR